MARELKFQSYCWSVGTTGYRTKDFNLNIEKQLFLLKEFRSQEKWKGKSWRSNKEMQRAYYEYLKVNGILEGNAGRPEKDARLKTSGLVDIGLVDSDRNLTECGMALLKISQKRDFASDNLLELEKDSYIYLKQLLKTENLVEGNRVRPFVVFLSVLLQMDFYLTFEEFTYLLPLCIHPSITKEMVCKMKEMRAGAVSVDEILLSRLMEMDNYCRALEYLQISYEVNEEIICEIGMNRDGGGHDKIYWKLYQDLSNIVLNKNSLGADVLYETIKKISDSKIRGAWREYLFVKSNEKAVKKDGLRALTRSPLLMAQDRREFNRIFFQQMHLFKVKATLFYYFDLNRRYFLATGSVIFEDQKVTLDLLPRCYFNLASKYLEHEAYKSSQKLFNHCPIEEILPGFEIKPEMLYDELSKLAGETVASAGQAKGILKREKYRRFRIMADSRFSNEQLLDLLDKFEKRQDKEIRRLVTNNADVPTIFEYILGIIWYRISDNQGDVLDYMNLSLEADLLPKTHAGGGAADIIWRYEACSEYPEHVLLLEATLAESSNQRRMEMEPVSRHVGDYQLSHPQTNVYGIFATTSLHKNVISDFRNRKSFVYYNSSGDQYIQGMKILPLDTNWLKEALKRNLSYRQLYARLDEAWLDDRLLPLEWYDHYMKFC